MLCSPYGLLCCCSIRTSSSMAWNSRLSHTIPHQSTGCWDGSTMWAGLGECQLDSLSHSGAWQFHHLGWPWLEWLGCPSSGVHMPSAGWPIHMIVKKGVQDKESRNTQVHFHTFACPIDLSKLQCQDPSQKEGSTDKCGRREEPNTWSCSSSHTTTHLIKFNSLKIMSRSFSQ